MTWNYLIVILHINDCLSCGTLFRIVHTNYLLQVAFLKIALETAAITMAT